MKLSIIAPPGLFYYEAVTNFHLLPCHHLDSRMLREFYCWLRERGDYVILDNGVTELGYAVSLVRLLNYVQMVNAHELVLPDVFDDGPATVESTLTAGREVREKHIHMHDVKLMGVVHGRTEDEWLWAYKTLADSPYVDVLGLPKVMTKNFGNRVEFLRNVFMTQRAPAQQRSTKPHHLLGVWDDPYEIEDVNNALPWVRSIDTSIAVMAGVTMQDIEQLGPGGVKKMQLQERLVRDNFPVYTMNNIALLCRWTEHSQGA